MKLFRAVHLLLWLGLLKGRTQGRGFAAPSNSLAVAGAAAAADEAAYFAREPGGSYSFAYRSKSGLEGQQSASDANEVTGQYSFYEDGIPYIVKYTAGVNGFRPEIFVASHGAALDQARVGGGVPAAAAAAATAPATPSSLNILPSAIHPQSQSQSQSQPLQFGSFGASHSFVRSSLTPLAAFASSSSTLQTTDDSQQLSDSADTPQSYNFAYNSDLQARSESGDGEGNVMGKYSYYDEAGYHDLVYKAGADGFTVLGGSLSEPPATQPPPPPPPPPVASVGVFSFNPPPLPLSLTKSSLLQGAAAASPAVESRSLRKFRRHSKW